MVPVMSHCFPIQHQRLKTDGEGRADENPNRQTRASLYNLGKVPILNTLKPQVWYYLLAQASSMSTSKYCITYYCQPIILDSFELRCLYQSVYARHHPIQSSFHHRYKCLPSFSIHIHLVQQQARQL